MSEVLIKKEKFYYTVKLNRPDKHNAFNPAMIKQLTDFFQMAEKDKFAGAIVLSGQGKSFCSGGDLNWMQSTVGYSIAENAQDAKALFEMYESAKNCTLPIVGLLHGNVFGGGVGLAAICDIAIADYDTKFCFSEVRLGLVPAVISSFVLDKMNINKAKEMMLTGQVFDGKIAYDSGLVEFVGRELEAKAYLDNIIKSIAHNGREATREIKKLIRGNRFADQKSIKDICIRIIAERRTSDEGQEGMKSFLEKRKPAWTWSTEDKDE